MKKIIIFFIIAIFSIQSVDVSVGEEVFGDATNKTNEYKGCEHVIIGGGWGGSYFAWRSSVDSDSQRKTLMDPKTVCLFEATNRIGGRAYSKEGIPGMQDLIIDLGAYRFDSHTHVLVNHVITKVLGHSTKCYDDGKCNKYGNLTVIKDSYGNALGYKKGPVGLIDLFKQKGGRVFLEHQLTKIDRGSDNKRILLTFKNGASLTCSSAFLNLPKPSLDYLDSNSILFTSSSEETKFALSVPKQDPGSKQYLIYKNAPWRKFKKLREGTFINKTIKNPPLNGRLHEFYGKCSPDYDNMDCWGAILTYYDFIMEDVKYFSKFQKSTSDPYTYIKFDENSNSEESEMIRKAHNQFCQALDSFNVPGFNSSSLPYPEGTVISVWWARDEASSILPPPSYMGQHDLKYMVDPNHAIRNRISKPLDEFNIYIANEAFSGGNGWAEPSLIMTERILWKHFKSKPTWIEDVNDCFYGDSKNCSDVPSEIWWKNKIDHLIDTTKFITNCEKTKDSLVTVENDKCVVIREKGRQLRSVPNDKCTTRFKYEHLDLSWEWISTTDIKIIYQIVAKGWAGLGIGSSMSKADMVIARRLGNKQCVVEQYWSEGHVAPKITEEKYIYNVSCKISNNDRLVVSFSRPMSVDSTKNNQSMPIFNDKPTDIIYAFNDDTNSDKELKQHNTYGNLKADFSCGKLLVPLFDRDIVQLFREKDREAMLFAFDLHDYNQTKAVAKELLDVLKANAIYSLEDGMPKDKSWSVLELHTLIAWIDTNYSTSNISCGEKSPTFSNDIKVLFRAKDRNSMLFMFDLWDYNDVKTNGPAIYKSLLGQTMPCDSEGRWTKEKLDTFNTWMLCGYEEGNDQSSLTDREVFYYGMNIEDFESKRPLLKKNLKQYLSLARQQGTPEANPLNSTKYRIFQNYTNEYFSSFCDNLYADLAKQAEEYDPVNDPDFNTKNKVLNRITQMAPFNLVDGTWISNCCPTGPIDEVHSMLWGILNDEMGMGEVSKNHCQLYQELLNSVGVYTSPIHTLDFANDVRFLDSAFTQPAYAILLSLFSREHFEELLGTTLQIEWCVLGIVPSLNLLKFWGINPHFYELHVGIDNAAKGHGYRARRAIEIYLDNVRENKGEKGVQESWRRIWDGFLAFDALGTLGDDLNEMNMKLSSPEKQVLELIEQKAKYGHFNHRSKRLGDPLINDLFSDSQLFLESLRDSAWIVKGNPDASPLMNHLLSFAGPMFKVFDDNDINVWRNWIWSLKTNKHQKGKVDSYDAMRNLVKRVMMTAMSEEAHHRIRIWGPSPNNNSELIEQSVTNWLEASRNDPDIMLSVLSHPQNRLIIKEKPFESHFVTSVIKPGSEMGAVYVRAASDAPDLVDDKHKSSLWSWTDIVVRWIEDGCPMKQLPGHTYSLFPQPKVKKSKSRRKRRHKKSGRHHVH